MGDHILKFQKIQQSFTDAIRNPADAALDIESRRLKIYQDLFFNNIEGFIAGAFPVFKELFTAEDWQWLVRDFFIRHSCSSPYFLKISEEFLQYLESSPLAFLPAFSYQLAHWEWMELFADVYVDDSVQSPVVAVNFSQGSYQTINTAWALSYEFPVHRISVDYQPIDASPVFLLVHRNVALKVGFIELNPLSYLLFLALSGNQQQTLNEILTTLATEHQMDVQTILKGGQEILMQWCERGLITQLP